MCACVRSSARGNDRLAYYERLVSCDENRRAGLVWRGEISVNESSTLHLSIDKPAERLAADRVVDATNE